MFPKRRTQIPKRPTHLQNRSSLGMLLWFSLVNLLRPSPDDLLRSFLVDLLRSFLVDLLRSCCAQAEPKPDPGTAGPGPKPGLSRTLVQAGPKQSQPSQASQAKPAKPSQAKPAKPSQASQAKPGHSLGDLFIRVHMAELGGTARGYVNGCACARPRAHPSSSLYPSWVGRHADM